MTARAAVEVITRALTPYVHRPAHKVNAALRYVAMTMLGWDGREHRVRLDDVYGPWQNPIEYRLRDKTRAK